MRARYALPSLLTIVMCATLILAGSARASLLADPVLLPTPSAPDTAITPLLQYQGRMTNPSTGQPVSDGVYAVTFTLYNAGTGGTVLWTETKNVPVTGGLFSTALGDTTPLSSTLFSGQALWLGIKVGSDLEATPRQAVLPVAYAMSLVPGAVITGSSTNPTLWLGNTSGGVGLYVAGPTTLSGNVTINGTLSGGTHTHSGAAITSGTVAAAYIDPAIARTSNIMSTVLANDGTGSGLDADLLDGAHANAFSPMIHTHDGSAIVSGLVSEARIDPAIARDAEVAAAYYNMSTSDGRYVNVTGPETMSANSILATLAVNQTGTGMAGFFTSTNNFGVQGGTGSTAPGQAGVLGFAGSAGASFYRESGVLGTALDGFGVSGMSLNNFGVIGYSANSDAVRGEAHGTGPGASGYNFGTGIGVYGSSSGSHGVRGVGGSGSGDYGGYFSGYGGVYGNSPSWVGVYGNSDGNWGVYGSSSTSTGYGVMGRSVDGTAVYGSSNDGYGVSGTTYTTTKYAGYFYNGGGSGTARGGGVAGFTGSGGTSDVSGWWHAGGEFAGPNGVIGAASESNGVGVVAVNAIAGPALYASKPSGSGNTLQVTNGGTGSAVSINNNASSTSDALQLWNYSTGRAAYLYNSSSSTSDALSVYNYGTGRGAYFYNSANNGGDAFVFNGVGTGYTLNAYSGASGAALYAYKSGGGNWAGYFFGNVYVNGTLSKAGGSFKIDHPLDPANKYLEHSFVESPDMMNVYNGNITTDANGDATVALPDYFEALNRDFRYQLTVIGQFAQAIVKDEVKHNQFTIKTDKPNVKVSWQVTGIRQDAWANANRIPVEEDKPADEQGTYLYPQGYGQPASKGLDYERSQLGQGTTSAPDMPLKQTGVTSIVPFTPTAPLTPLGSASLPVSSPSTLP
jgi:hypothetical protein